MDFGAAFADGVEVQAQEEVGTELLGFGGAGGQFHEGVGAAGEGDFDAGFFELVANFLGEEQGEFFFGVRADAVAGVLAAMAGVEDDELEFFAGRVLRRGRERLNSGLQIEGSEARAGGIAGGDGVGEPDVHAVDFGLGRVDGEDESLRGVGEGDDFVALHPGNFEVVVGSPVTDRHIVAACKRGLPRTVRGVSGAGVGGKQRQQATEHGGQDFHRPRNLAAGAA